MKTGKIMKVSFVAALLYCFVAVGTAGAADYVTLGVVRFTSKTPGVSDQQAEIITDVFTRVLANSKSIAVIERERLDVIGKEHKLNLSGLVDTSLAVKVGRLAGCQYMLLGSVTELNQTVSGVRVPLGGRSSALGTNEATATIDMRIVNVTTSELVLALSESGKSSQSGFEINLPGWGFGQGQFGGLEQRAIVAAVSRLGHRIREELGGEYSYVLNSRGRNIQINLGLTSGVKVGDTYLVYSEGEKIFDIDGTFIEREKLNVAVLKVIDVQSGYSLCNVAAEGGKADLIR
ncbi:MAG: hypothetical protein LBQ90_02470, partial [Synergistaceae bacterium]|nr:hypothetical protein [Synergistaceae bacterium]